MIAVNGSEGVCHILCCSTGAKYPNLKKQEAPSKPSVPSYSFSFRLYVLHGLDAQRSNPLDDMRCQIGISFFSSGAQTSSVLRGHHPI